jgi:hypothetical protein
MVNSYQDATATTYSLGCASNVASEDCGVPPDFTIAQGASTMNYVISYADECVSALSHPLINSFRNGRRSPKEA